MWQLGHMTPHDEAAVEHLSGVVEEIGTGSDLGPGQLRELIDKRVIPSAAQIATSEGAEALFAISLDAANPVVRASLLEPVAAWCPNALAIETVMQHIRDPDDLVCLPAISRAGRERLEEAIPYFVDIVGWPSAKVLEPGKPVGMGAAHLLVAFNQILGTDDPAEAERRRHCYESTRRIPRDACDGQPPVPAFGDLCAAVVSHSPPDDMIVVPGGCYTVGVDAPHAAQRQLAWADATPSRQVVELPFCIDRYPVTTAQYDEFCAAVASTEHQYCHPLEANNKDHTRNTRWDERFGRDHPVTGIDWFDAYAYARWAGKDLPTEHQWEIAARGPGSFAYPWGEDWDPTGCTWVLDTVRTEPDTLDAWRRSIIPYSRSHPTTTTTAVTRHDQHRSPFGVCDLVGNAWEWTKTDHESGLNVCPGLAPLFDRPVSAVLKGGSWSSIRSMLHPSYRGRDALFCRHSEIGFRCVVNLDNTHRRTFGAAGRANRELG